MNEGILGIDPEAAQETVRGIYGADFDDILLVGVRSSHVAVLQAIDALAPTMDVGPFCVTMLHETRSGGLLDPAHLGVDVVWCRLLTQLALHDIATACLLGRKLASNLTQNRFDDEAVNGVVEAVVSLFVGALV